MPPSLTDQLDAIRAAAQTRIPPEARAVMERAVHDVRASGLLDRVVKVGARAPEFTLPNTDGRPVSLATLVARGPVVLSFFRGRWWPYCNAELAALQAALPEISAAGASLVVISPQVQRSRRETGAEPAVTFEVLRDQGNGVARRYGVAHALPPDLQAVYRGFGLDLPAINGDDGWTLPVPSRFVIDRTGTIRSVDADPDYTRRPEPARTVEFLRGLRA